MKKITQHERFLTEMDADGDDTMALIHGYRRWQQMIKRNDRLSRDDMARIVVPALLRARQIKREKFDAAAWSERERDVLKLEVLRDLPSYEYRSAGSTFDSRWSEAIRIAKAVLKNHPLALAWLNHTTYRNDTGEETEVTVSRVLNVLAGKPDGKSAAPDSKTDKTFNERVATVVKQIEMLQTDASTARKRTTLAVALLRAFKTAERAKRTPPSAS